MPLNVANTDSNLKILAKPMLGENYIYISHLDEGLRYWFLPDSPDSIQDSMNSNFQAMNALGRSAPLYTYNNSGPRSVQLSLTLHRDLMDDINLGKSNSVLGTGEDYVENLVHALQAIALPSYNLTNKSIEPPLVAIRFANQVFIKGIVDGTIGLVYKKPILYNNKYAEIDISFTVTEVDPYDASSVYKNGSLRGMMQTLRTGMNLDSLRA